MSRDRWIVGIVVCVVTMALGTGLSRAQDEKKKPESKSGKDEVKGRLPLYFGQIGLSGKQEDEVRKVAQPFDERIAKLKKQIDELNKQIDDIEKEKLVECEKQLNERQKTALVGRREEAAKESKKGKKTANGDSANEKKQ